MIFMAYRVGDASRSSVTYVATMSTSAPISRASWLSTATRHGWKASPSSPSKQSIGAVRSTSPYGSAWPKSSLGSRLSTQESPSWKRSYTRASILSADGDRTNLEPPLSDVALKQEQSSTAEAVLTAHDLSEKALTTRAGWRQLDYLPINLFASVMGLTGLSIAWRLAQSRYGAPAWVAASIGDIALVAFVAVALGYAVKLATAPQAVRAEFRHPIAGNMFGTFVISLLLLPIILAPMSLRLAQAIWAIGAVGMAALAWLIVNRWMSDRQSVAYATPAWIVPVVGLLDVPLALPSLGLPQMHAVAVFGLAVGLFFALPLFTLIFSRLLFEAPLPDALRPSLLILTAPFSVGFSAYLATTGDIDLFAQSLYMLMLFMLAVLLPRLRLLGRCCPFRVSWWAISFPLAASASAALRYAAFEPGWVTDTIALALLALATVIIAGLFVRTLVGIAQGELRTLSG
jgi:tellurite resistance protein